MIEPTRRQLLVLGLAGAGAAAAGGAGLWWSSTGVRAGPGGQEAVQPPVLSSEGGVLELALDAAPARVQVGGRAATVLAFNGSLPGPTLRVRPGDTIRATLTNNLGTPTNLHVHGLHVTPHGNSDNAFLSIKPGTSFDYEFVLPRDHPPGTYWYHPHHHGHVADQVSAGLYGAIVVEDPDPVPVSRERVLVVSDLSLALGGRVADPGPMQRMMGREGQIVLVNGQVNPRLAAAPGERERWRIVNACTARYLRLQLAGQDMRLLSRDLGRLREPLAADGIELAPGNRVELLVDTREGKSTLLTVPVERGGMDGMMGPGGMDGMMGPGWPGAGDPVELLSLDVSGSPVGTLPPVPSGPRLRDLRREPVSGRHTLEFGMAMGMGGMMGGPNGRGRASFTINGRGFDPDRLDTPVQAGGIEEWTLVNSSPMDHPIHLHVWPMQVVEDGTRDLSEPTWQDVVNIPARSEVKVLVAFEDFGGRTVYHCHILDHEDQGMMGTVETRP